MSLGEFGESFCALHDRAYTLKTHARIDMARGQRGERTVWIGVELDEDQIPDLDALCGAFVDERAARVALRREIDMQLGARPARSRVAHHPEVVLLVARNDVHCGVEPGRSEMTGPVVPCLLIKFARVSLCRRIDRGVEPRRGKLPSVDQKLPCPSNGLFFEIIPEAPVAEHLKESVVVGVESDVLEVIVLAAGADAFLRVRRAAVGSCDRSGPARDVRVGLAEKNRHKLVHARVGEEQIR